MPVSNSSEFDDFLPDYVAECDEHLTAAGQVLLEVEAAPERVDSGQLDGLFRNFHTVKGLSAMVGVREAERLAHALESYLGAVRKGRIALTADGVALLIDCVQTLDRVVAARRDQIPAPDVDPLISRLTVMTPDRSQAPPGRVAGPSQDQPAPEARPLSEDKESRVDAALRQGSRAWQVTFVPNPALAERGVTVNTVRERLQAAGEIIHAEPAVVPGRGITFAFIVTSRVNDFPATVGSDGLTVEPYSPARASVASPGAEPGRLAAPLTPANLVRVDLGRLDDLMRTVGELVITRARLDNGLGRVAAALPVREWRDLQETSRVLERQLRSLREGVMRVRLVPIRDLFARMQFVVRDLTRETGKDVALVLTGEETEIDKFVVERLADPLLHLVRNAVSHGLESPAERAAAGKPPRGRIDLRAASAGGAIVVEVEDDGHGIDTEQVFSRARALGLVPADAPADPAAVLELICTPGFSTQEATDRASGRGVGMDVVRRAVEDLGGDLTLTSQHGQGTRFTARLPLTLAIADALIVEVGGRTYAIPQVAVREVIPVEPAAITAMENNELLRHRAGVLPLLRLSDLFGSARPAGSFPVLVVGEGGQAVAVAADRVLGLREVVVHPLADPLVQVPGLAGATELGDGRAVLILDIPRLSRHARTFRLSVQ